MLTDARTKERMKKMNALQDSAVQDLFTSTIGVTNKTTQYSG